MQELPLDRRQQLGCGYAPPPSPHLASIVRPWAGLGYRGPRPTTCPGYTTNLPEVVEIARAHRHWSKGSLEAFCGGPPPEAVITGVEIFDAAMGELEAWRATPASQGGGAGDR